MTKKNPLRMEHSIGLDESTGLVWLEIPADEAAPDMLEQPYYRDVYADGTVAIALPLDEIEDAPSCGNCGAITLDVKRVEDPSNEGEYADRCPCCAEVSDVAA